MDDDEQAVLDAHQDVSEEDLSAHCDATDELASEKAAVLANVDDENRDTDVSESLEMDSVKDDDQQLVSSIEGSLEDLVDDRKERNMSVEGEVRTITLLLFLLLCLCL